ncbi:hypothetical protein [Trichormus sp. NMC-1]|uniref:hypothetical protein n=1 Tax=Trichormus sp. NMC-1 TaxID=1853259 RepID=UPI00115FE4C2|nr:hypothetical protein [Trichormus sp. NMC-1]
MANTRNWGLGTRRWGDAGTGRRGEIIIYCTLLESPPAPCLFIPCHHMPNGRLPPMPNATDKTNWPLPDGQRFLILSKLCDLKSG